MAPVRQRLEGAACPRRLPGSVQTWRVHVFMDAVNASDPLQLLIKPQCTFCLGPTCLPDLPRTQRDFRRDTAKRVARAQGEPGPQQPQVQLMAQEGSEACGLRQVTEVSLRAEVDTFISNTVPKYCKLRAGAWARPVQGDTTRDTFQTAPLCISTEQVLSRKFGTERMADETPENVLSGAAACPKGRGMAAC